MISFKQFLIEDDPIDPKVYRATAMDAASLIEWCEKNASRFLENVKTNKVRVYRGTEPQMGVVDTNKFQRKSANTLNYYTLWLDNSPKWKDYPKRSKSLICTNDMGTAGGFGDIHWVIPKDSNAIGVCPSDDFWSSFHFSKQMDMGQSHDIDPSDLMDFTWGVLTIVDQNNPVTEKSYSALLAALRKCNAKVLLQIIEKKPKSWHAAFAKSIIAKGFRNLAEVYDFLFDPAENNFSHTVAARLKNGHGAEYWIQGECALIPTQFAEIYSHADKAMLKEFVIKYKLI